MTWFHSTSLVALLSFTSLGFADANLSSNSAAESMGEQSGRALIYLTPGDFKCVDAHTGGFGNHIPGVISFQPHNHIDDVDQFYTRVPEFFKTLSDTATCKDYYSELPKNNRWIEFHRKVIGDSGVSNSDREVGELVETVEMTVSPHLTLSGQFQWIDWSVPRTDFDSSEDFGTSFINAFDKVESDIQISTASQGALKCKTNLDGHVELSFPARGSEFSNAVDLQRVYDSGEACDQALTEIMQSLEARGIPWLGVIVPAHRSLQTTSRAVGFHDCVNIRLERIETEIEGIKFIGTNFIPLGSGFHHNCPVEGGN